MLLIDVTRWNKLQRYFSVKSEAPKSQNDGCCDGNDGIQNPPRKEGALQNGWYSDAVILCALAHHSSRVNQKDAHLFPERMERTNN